jgi:hypothetical protein
MTKNLKYITIGGITLAIIAFLGFKAFSKPKPKLEKKKDDPLIKPNRVPVKVVDPILEPIPVKVNKPIISDRTGKPIIPNKENSHYVYTSKSGARLRSKPNTNSSILYTYPAGVKIFRIGNNIFDKISKQNWIEAVDNEGRYGYVAESAYIIYDFKETLFSEPDYKTKSGARLHSEPSENSSLLYTYPAGVKVMPNQNVPRAINGGRMWVKVSDDEGRKGWIKGWYILY